MFRTGFYGNLQTPPGSELSDTLGDEKPPKSTRMTTTPLFAPAEDTPTETTNPYRPIQKRNKTFHTVWSVLGFVAARRRSRSCTISREMVKRVLPRNMTLLHEDGSAEVGAPTLMVRAVNFYKTRLTRNEWGEQPTEQQKEELAL